MDVARLINEVYKRNGIWDHRTSCHYMRDAVASLWNEIAEVLEAPVDAVKAKWRNLRDTYTAECRKMYKQYKDKEPVTRSKWVWFSSMDFLRPHLKRLRELQEGKFHISNNTPPAVPIRHNNNNNSMTRTRLKKLLKAEHFKTEADEDEQSLIENVEVDIMPNEALLHAVTHLEEDEEGTVDINEDHHDNTMNVAINPAFAFNYTNMMNTNNTNRNHDNRKRHWQITTPISLANSTPSTNEPERKRRRHIEDDLKTLRPGEVDDTYHFLISLREPLKSLTLDRQMYVRYKIQELLFNETSESQKNVQNESTEPLETSDIIAVGNIKTEPPDST